MKKKSVSMLLATAMVVSLLTGCGSKNNSAADTTKEETQTEATAEATADEAMIQHQTMQAKKLLLQYLLPRV